MEHYPHLPRDLDGLHAFCEEHYPERREVDRWFSGPPEARVFRKGKHEGHALDEVAASDSDYLGWMIRAENMDEEVVRIAQEALRRRASAAPPPQP